MEKEFAKKIRKKLRLVKLSALALFSNLNHRIKRLIKPPQWPTNADGKVLIHLGCGEQNAPGWVNVDAQSFPHTHFVGPVERLPMFPDNSADLIYACHVLEHLAHGKLEDTLREWRRVLKSGGVLRVSVPDFEKIIVIYEAEKKSIASIEAPLLGGQNYQFNFHKSVFNQKYLEKLLRAVGFTETRLWDPTIAKDYPFNDWAKKLVHGKYPISLNIEGVK